MAADVSGDLLTRLATHRQSRELRGAPADTLALYDEAIEALKAQAQRIGSLENIIENTLWMAGRYADGRSTYATEDYNRAAYWALKLGLPLRRDPTTGTIWAKDGSFGYPNYANEAGELHQPQETQP